MLRLLLTVQIIREKLFPKTYWLVTIGLHLLQTSRHRRRDDNSYQRANL